VTDAAMRWSITATVQGSSSGRDSPGRGGDQAEREQVLFHYPTLLCLLPGSAV
jgi:hypothetical protein